jgi:hypothetical protein
MNVSTQQPSTATAAELLVLVNMVAIRDPTFMVNLELGLTADLFQQMLSLIPSISLYFFSNRKATPLT